MKAHASEFEFWARQLVPFLDDTSVIFAAFQNSKFEKIQLLDVVKELKNIDYFDAVESINVAPHPKFIKIKFDSPSMVEICKDTVDRIGQWPISYVDKDFLASTCIISIANLAADQIKSLVAPLLLEWGEILKVFPQLIPKKNGKAVQIGQTRFEFKFKEGVLMEHLPYFLKIHGFRIYLHVKGRQKICFRCSSKSHLVSDCPVKFCGLCRALKPISHLCVLSYAAAVSKDDSSDVAARMHDELLVHVEQDPGLAVSPLQLSSPNLESDSVQHGSSPSLPSLDSLDVKIVDSITSVEPGKLPSVDGALKRMRTRSLSKAEKKLAFRAAVENSIKNSLGLKQISPPQKKKKNVKAESAKEADLVSPVPHSTPIVASETPASCLELGEPPVSECVAMSSSSSEDSLSAAVSDSFSHGHGV